MSTVFKSLHFDKRDRLKSRKPQTYLRVAARSEKAVGAMGPRDMEDGIIVCLPLVFADRHVALFVSDGEERFQRGCVFWRECRGQCVHVVFVGLRGIEEWEDRGV